MRPESFPGAERVLGYVVPAEGSHQRRKDECGPAAPAPCPMKQKPEIFPVIAALAIVTVAGAFELLRRANEWVQRPWR